MTKKASSLLNDYHLLACEELDSTNEEAKRLAKGGGAHGAFIWAKKQSAGHGRYGRPWVSEEGNLFTSVLLAPECGMEKATQLSYVAGLAAHETISALLPEGVEASCKWPNDIVVNGHKLAGLLLESFQHDDKFWVVIGLGVNVESHPEGVNFPATSLRGEGVEIISAKIVLSRFIHQFIECYNLWERKGFAPIRRAWMKHAWRLGEPIRAVTAGEEVEGIFKDVDADGALVLQISARKKRLIHTADVFPAEALEAAS